jgi:hypothetical protein
MMPKLDEATRDVIRAACNLSVREFDSGITFRSGIILDLLDDLNELRLALKPFADVADTYDAMTREPCNFNMADIAPLQIALYRGARAALQNPSTR